MKLIKPSDFTAARAWGSQFIVDFNNVGVRLHWTDSPYVWHKNIGDEVFVVLDGVVKMQTRRSDSIEEVYLNVGDVLHIQEGEEHRACPIGEARILVIESTDSL